MYTWQTRKHRMDKITPIQDFMIPAGRLSKHLNMFTHESQHTNTYIYAWSQTQTQILFSCVWSNRCFLHRASLRTLIYYAAAYCYNKASVLCSHHPQWRGWWLSDCTRSHKQRLFWHAAHNKSMLCDVCTYEGNCWQFQPEHMRTGWMEQHFPSEKHLK